MKKAEIDSINKAIEEYQNSEELELAEALAVLKATPEWKLLIDKALLEDTAVRLVHLRKDPNIMLNPDPLQQLQLQSIDEMLNCIGTLSAYIRGVEAKGSEIKDYIQKLENKKVA